MVCKATLVNTDNQPVAVKMARRKLIKNQYYVLDIEVQCVK